MQALDAKLIIVVPFRPLHTRAHQNFTDSPVAQKEFYNKPWLLKKIAEGFKCVVLITSHMIFNSNNNYQFTSILIMGGTLSPTPLISNCISKNQGKTCGGWKSSIIPSYQNDYKEFYLTSHGIYDEAEFPKQILQEEKTESEEESLTTPLMEGLKEISEVESNKVT